MPITLIMKDFFVNTISSGKLQPRIRNTKERIGFRYGVKFNNNNFKLFSLKMKSQPTATKESTLLVPTTWTTPIYIFALKLYAQTYGRLPYLGLHINFSEHQHPTIVVPRFNITAGTYILYQYFTVLITLFVLFRTFITS